MNSKSTKTNAAREAGQTVPSILKTDATKVQLGEAVRKAVKNNEVTIETIAQAKLIAAEAGRKTVSMADVTQAGSVLLERVRVAQQKNAKIDKANAKVVRKVDKGETASIELNWAYRRLRRQALLFFGQTLKSEGHLSNLKQLREDLESVPESYAALKAKCERLVEDDNKLHGTWESFMEFFFGHVIHPGARGPLDQ